MFGEGMAMRIFVVMLAGVLLGGCGKNAAQVTADPACKYIGGWIHQFSDSRSQDHLTIARNGSAILATVQSEALANGTFPATVQDGVVDIGQPYGRLVLINQDTTLLMLGQQWQRDPTQPGGPCP
jgi:hypothetical protein